MAELELKIRDQTDLVVKEKRRNKALLEVFKFYCKQHINYGKGVATFDSLEANVSNMSAGDWMMFNRDFGITAKNKLSIKVNTSYRQTVTDIYKNCARGRDLLNFEEFKQLLVKIAEELAVNVPFLKTSEQKLESLYEYLDLMDPKLQRRLKQNTRPFAGVGPITGPSPKEKEEAEAQKLYKERQQKKMVGLGDV